MNKKIPLFLSTLTLAATPALALAARSDCPAGNGGATLCTYAYIVVDYFNVALEVLMAFAVVMFTYYVIQYYIKPNEDRKNAGQYVMYSIIGFFVILSMWGLVNILSNTFGGLGNSQTTQSTLQNLPLFPTN